MKKFFEELSRRLREGGVESSNVEDRRLEIFLHGQPVLFVSPGNDVFLFPAGSNNPEASELYHRVAQTADEVYTYTNKIVDMFAADRTVSVKLICENKLMKTIIDHYGEAVPTRTYDEEHFTANIEVDPSGTFYGWVFKFMGGIQIIAPQECIEEMKRIAHRFL